MTKWSLTPFPSTPPVASLPTYSAMASALALIHSLTASGFVSPPCVASRTTPPLTKCDRYDDGMATTGGRVRARDATWSGEYENPAGEGEGENEPLPEPCCKSFAKARGIPH